METDDELEEFVAEPFVAKEFDLDYEFDAAKYYDFSRPETEWEAREADRWFNSAGSYPPSPLIIKLDWGKSFFVECKSSGTKDGQHMSDVRTVLGESVVSATDDYNLDYRKIEVKSPLKSNLLRSSTLMKPTASHLAKQVQPRGVHSGRLLQRFEKSLSNIEEKISMNSPVCYNQETKRQKLEAGYLRKVAQLKHQPTLSHKKPKQAGLLDINSRISRRKVTIPKEPNLETARRALRRRFKMNTEFSEHAKSDTYTFNFKARPLNKKILEAPLFAPPKKSIPQMPEFQEFHLKTSERAIHHIYNDLANLCNESISQAENMDSNRPSSHAIKQELNGTVNKLKARPVDKILSSREEVDVLRSARREATTPKEIGFLNHKKLTDEPPVELFSKLSLASEFQHSVKSQYRTPSLNKVS